MIKVDITYSLKENIGDNGISLKEIKAIYPELKEVREKLIKEANEGKIVFFRLPEDEKIIEEINKFKESIEGKYKNALLLGIGGSSLGAKSAIDALSFNKKEKKALKFFFLDNIDPEKLFLTLNSISAEETLVLVITKSGTTLETIFEFLVAREWLKKSLGENYKNNIIAITDPEEGYLRKVVKKEGYHSFPIPKLLGGRYSVLSPVGLLPMALSGIDIKELINGAKKAMKEFFQGKLKESLSLITAGVSYLFYKKKYFIRVMMAYSDFLSSFVDWFLQLWAESLAKGEEGQTPLKAIGTTDQHSLLQLFIEGPKDKFINFIKVENPRKNISAPVYDLDGEERDEIERICEGRNAGEIMEIEYRATTASLAMNNRPSITYIIDSITPFSLGYLYYLFMVETAVMGYLLKVNPFDQPGVELGKNIAHGLLERKGYENYKKKFHSMEKKFFKFIIRGEE